MGGRLKAGVLLVAMFSLGMVSGISWQNFHIQHQGLHRFYATQRMKWLKHRLHLSPVQEEALNQIVEDAHDRMAEIHQNEAPDIAEIHQDSLDLFWEFLTPEQRKTFDKLNKKSDKKSEAKRFQRDPQSPETSPATSDETNDDSGTAS